MTTPPVENLPTNPTIPLTPELKAAYEDLLAKIQTQLDATVDPAVTEALNSCWNQVDQVLAKDGEYRFSADTAIFEALQKQIDDTNDGLKTLRGQIASIAGHFALAGDIIAGIDQVLSFFPSP